VTTARSEARSSSGISFQTLAIASLSSVAAAILVHEVWRGGAILGAAITPVIVGIVGEALRRPVDRLSAVRDGGRKLPADRRTDVPPVSRARGDDPFGLWEDQRKRRSRSRTWLTLGVVTGVIGFAVAAFLLTGSELVFGGSVTGPKRTTIFGGGGTQTTTQTTVQTVTRTTTTPTVTQTVPVAPPAERQATPTVTQTTPAPPPAGIAPQQEAPTTPQTGPTPTP
jgi:hypothetical protein